jgi:hypothetical protein
MGFVFYLWIAMIFPKRKSWTKGTLYLQWLLPNTPAVLSVRVVAL